MSTFADRNSDMVVAASEQGRASFEKDVALRKSAIRDEIVRGGLPITVADAAMRAVEAMSAGLRVEAAAWLAVGQCLVRGVWS